MEAKPASWAFDATKVDFWKTYGAAGLWLLPLWEGAGDDIDDVGVLNKPGVRAGLVKPAWAADAMGECLDFAGTPSRVDLNAAITFPDLMADGSCTLFAIVRPDAGGEDHRGVMSDYDAGGSFRAFQLEQYFTGAENRWRLYWMTTAWTERHIESDTWVESQLAVLVATWDLTDPLHHTMTLFVDGVGEAPVDCGIEVLMNNAAQVLAVGRWGGMDSRYFRGNILLAGAQRGAWTLPQIVAFSAEPFDVLKEAAAAGPSPARAVSYMTRHSGALPG